MHTLIPRRLLILAPLLLLVTSAHAAPPDPAKLAAISDALKPLVDQNEISGAVTYVATKDKVLHLAAIGEADIAAHAPMKTDSIFWIASMTKPITGACIMMLQDEDKLSIDDQVSKYIPEFAYIKTPSGKEANLSLRHLLTHTSGLSEVTPDEQKAAKNLTQLLPNFVGKPTAFEPGTQWRYSQTGINTLGRIVEVVSGKSFPDFLAERVTGPLGMKDTTFYPTFEQQKRLAKSYNRDKDGKLVEVPIFVFEGQDLASTDRIPLANGGLFSTASDYGRFLQMVLNGGTLDGKTYLSPKAVKQMTSVAHKPVTNKMGFVPGTKWGLGWIVTTEPQGVTAMLSVGTAGHGGAYGTEAWVDFDRGVALVMMIQRKNFANPGGADGSIVRQTFQQAAIDAVK